MAKKQPLKDPANHLKNLIATRGKSERYATVFRGAHLMWDPHEHSHSDTYDDTMAYVLDITDGDGKYAKMIWALSHHTDGDHTYTFADYFGIGGVTALVEKEYEGDHLEVTFVFPYVDAAKFGLDVEILSHIAKLWAKVSGRSISKVCVFINRCFLRWEVMEMDNLLYTERESD